MPKKGEYKYTDDDLAAIAAKYDVLKEFSDNEPNIYRYILRRGLFDELCGHMERAEHVPYTEEELAEIASKYDNLTEFHKKEKRAYSAMQFRGLLKKLCAHMEKKRDPFTDEDLAEIASQYDVLKDLYTKDNAAYKEIRKRGLFDKLCGHLKRIQKESFTNEELIEIASKYKRKIDLMEGNKPAYRAIKRRKLDEQAFSHMESIYKIYTEDDLAEIASRYTDLTVFTKEEPQAYQAINSRGLAGKLYAHMKRHRRSPMSKKDLLAIASNYNSKDDFKIGDPSAFVVASRRGLLRGICRKMKWQIRASFTKEQCHAIARGYNSKTEFRREDKAAYSAAARHGWLKDICEHMSASNKGKKRKVYVFTFDDGYAYVGLTNNISRRKREHLNELRQNKKSPVLRHQQETGAKYEFKELTDWIDLEVVGQMENYYIEQYRANGWKMLNRRKGGDLGSRTEMYPSYVINKIVGKYEYAEHFREKEIGLYEYLCNKHLYSRYCSGLKHKRKSPGYWTQERSIAVIPECETRTIFQKRYYQAYILIKKAELLDNYYPPLNSNRKRRKWTKKRCIDIARMCKTRTELHKKYPGAYEALTKEGLLDDIIPSHKYWEKYNDDEKMKIIASCKTRSELSDNFRSVYDWLRLSGRLDEFYPKCGQRK